MPRSRQDIKKLKDLGQRVKTIREKRGLSLEQLAELIDKDRQSIHRLEQGGVNPGYLYLLQICKGLRIDLAELSPGIED